MPSFQLVPVMLAVDGCACGENQNLNEPQLYWDLSETESHMLKQNWSSVTNEILIVLYYWILVKNIKLENKIIEWFFICIYEYSLWHINELHNKLWWWILNPGTFERYRKDFVITFSHCWLQLNNMENKQFFNYLIFWNLNRYYNLTIQQTHIQPSHSHCEYFSFLLPTTFLLKN